MTRSVQCAACPVGSASGIDQGQFCPFIVRTYPDGAQVFRQGDKAGYVWYVKSGLIELSGDRGKRQLRHPNSFIGTEAAAGETYRATAHARGVTILCGATREGFAHWMVGNAERVCAVLCDSVDKSHGTEL